jgi:hypothetical protein
VQDASRASSQPLPRAGDFRISRRWGVRRAYNFMCGTRHWGARYPLRLDGRDVSLDRAHACLPGSRQESPWIRVDGRLSIRFRDGVLVAGER